MYNPYTKMQNTFGCWESFGKHFYVFLINRNTHNTIFLYDKRSISCVGVDAYLIILVSTNALLSFSKNVINSLNVSHIPVQIKSISPITFVKVIGNQFMSVLYSATKNALLIKRCLLIKPIWLSNKLTIVRRIHYLTENLSHLVIHFCSSNFQNSNALIKFVNKYWIWLFIVYNFTKFLSTLQSEYLFDNLFLTHIFIFNLHNKKITSKKAFNQTNKT